MLMTTNFTYSLDHHLLHETDTVQAALEKLNVLGSTGVLFVTNAQGVLKGSLTDGDIRRGFLEGKTILSPVTEVCHKSPKFIKKFNYTIMEIKKIREDGINLIPVLDAKGCLVNIVNLHVLKSYLPIDAVIMAGGKGARLQPLTDNCPKPLIEIQEKPILRHNIERLVSFGVDDFWICVGYLGHMIDGYLKSNMKENVSLQCIFEDQPRGTAGALKLIKEFKHDYILLMNADILTNINFEDFFIDFIESDADISIATIQHKITLPYAVLESKQNNVMKLTEKPTYTFDANAGIYFIKKEVLAHLPDGFVHITDLIEKAINTNIKVRKFNLLGYWTDIGRHEDLDKAKQDFPHIQF